MYIDNSAQTLGSVDPIPPFLYALLNCGKIVIHLTKLVTSKCEQIGAFGREAHYPEVTLERRALKSDCNDSLDFPRDSPQTMNL